MKIRYGVQFLGLFLFITIQALNNPVNPITISSSDYSTLTNDNLLETVEDEDFKPSNFLGKGKNQLWVNWVGDKSRFRSENSRNNLNLSALSTNQKCGQWRWDGPNNEKDLRIKTIPITEEQLEECRGMFRFSNDTGIWGIGGYSLDLKSRAKNAEVVWRPETSKGSHQALLPTLLDIELHSIPIDPLSDASVLIQGDMTLNSVAFDTTVFLIKSALAFSPPSKACLIPEEQILVVAIRTVNILTVASELALRGNIIAATKELIQIQPHFYEKSADIMAEIGIDCGFDLLKIVAYKPVVIAKIGKAYLFWVPKVIYDYIKYQGKSAYIELLYDNEAVTNTTKKPKDTPAEITAQYPISKKSVFHLPNDGIHNNDFLFLSRDPDLDVIELFNNIFVRDIEHSQTRCITCELANNISSNEFIFVIPAAMSDDRNLLAFSGYDSEFREMISLIIDLSEGKVLLFEGIMNKPFWHHDNRVVSFLNPGGGLTALDIKNHMMSLEVDGVIGGLVYDFAWAVDDQSLIFSMQNEKIVFINTIENSSYFLPPDSEDHAYTSPTWSPDGKYVSYVSNKSERSTGVTWGDIFGESMVTGGGDFMDILDLFLMDMVNNSHTCLTCDGMLSSHFINHPTWNSNGDKIAFFAQDISNYEFPGELSEGLYIINPDGSDLIMLVNFKDNSFRLGTNNRLGGPPVWSEDGRSIIFSAVHKDRLAIYSVDLDNKELHLLASDSEYDLIHPKWLSR